MLKIEMIQLKNPETGRVRAGYIARNHANGEAVTVNGRAFWGSEPGVREALAKGGYVEIPSAPGEYAVDVCALAGFCGDRKRIKARGVTIAHMGGVR